MCVEGVDGFGDATQFGPTGTDRPGDSVDDLMRAKTEQMEAVFQKTPLELPAAVRTERQELSLVVRGVLAAAAVVLGGYLIWQILQYFSGR